MEQLIQQLESRISQLVKALEAAQTEIAELKSSSTSHTNETEQSASLDLLQQMSKRSTEDQLQLYIEDSLDLLEPEKNTPAAPPKEPVFETQLSFNLTHEGTDSSAQTTMTTQTIDMTKPQTEQTALPETQAELTEQETAPANLDKVDSTASTEQSPATASLTPEQKRRQKNQKNNRRLIKMLEERYPKAFDWNQPKPLKVGIDKDMVLDEEFNASKQKRALAAYTRSDRYKKCLQTGQPRIDLEGNPVSDEPALPEAMLTRKPTTNRPKKEAQRLQNKATNKNKRPNNKPSGNPKANKPHKKEEDAFSHLSDDERMKAKLAQLLNK
ncbi:ProQ/FINO family protein [Marinomonas epiphytica]